MVKIAIVGWYGTETIGDRAILCGLTNLFFHVYHDFEINIGSIYPFLTERTLIEDEEFLKLCSVNNENKFKIFNSLSKKELDNAIKRSDLLVVGGGPLFDGYCMFMLEYAMRFARKANKRSLILGCGIGPLYKRRFIQSMKNIISNSNLCILRDETSKNQYKYHFGGSKQIFSSIDPAAFAAQLFLAENQDDTKKNDFYVANIIKFFTVYKKDSLISELSINQKTIEVFKSVLESCDNDFLLVPMHYSTIGGDDRIFMNLVKNKLKSTKIEVQNEPLNLEQTMKLFYKSRFCIGMRFHSILLQTILSGKNIVIDYTEPEVGKTGNFLRQIDAFDDYRKRYINLQNNDAHMFNLDFERFSIKNEIIDDFKEIYMNEIKRISL